MLSGIVASRWPQLLGTQPTSLDYRPIHMSTKLSMKRLTAIGGVMLDSTVATNVSHLTFRQDQTLLDPKITFEICQALIGL